MGMISLFGLFVDWYTYPKKPRDTTHQPNGYSDYKKWYPNQHCEEIAYSDFVLIFKAIFFYILSIVNLL